MGPAPKTAVEDVVETLHGVEVRDPYRWLEEAGSERVRDWVRAQQAHSRSFLDEMPERESVRARLAEALDCGAIGAQVPRGEHRFFTRRGPGMDQLALYVIGPDGSERTLVDPGPMSKDGTTALDWWYPSRDGELVCFGVSEAGAGAILYSREPEPGSVPEGEEMYHRHLWRHVIGTDPATDVEVFGAGREKTDFPSQVSTSADGRWVAVTVAQGWSRTACFLSRDGGRFQAIFEGEDSELHIWFRGRSPARDHQPRGAQLPPAAGRSGQTRPEALGHSDRRVGASPPGCRRHRRPVAGPPPGSRQLPPPRWSPGWIPHRGSSLRNIRFARSPTGPRMARR